MLYLGIYLLSCLFITLVVTKKGASQLGLIVDQRQLKVKNHWLFEFCQALCIWFQLTWKSENMNMIYYCQLLFYFKTW